VKELRPVITYPRDAIVEVSHVAAALGVSDEIVNGMDLPSFPAGKRPRFIWGQVLDVLAERADPVLADESKKSRRRVG
jgi:hypothetical protein